MSANDKPPSPLRDKVLQAIKDQNGLLFALPALVGRNIYAGRGVIAQNTDFSPSLVDARGYVPVEWWIMSKTVAKNAVPLENEGITSILVAGEPHPLPSILKVASEELMGPYEYAWPLTKVLDIGGPAQVPKYSCQGGEAEPEVPPIPCHVHAGEVCNGACIGPGKTESYFFPPLDVPPYNLSLGTIKTRLGLKPGTTKEQVLEALRAFGRHDDMYSLLNVYHINPWETWFIEEKIVHAPGPWTTFEIQRPQDDYNLLAWQLGRVLPEKDVKPTKSDHQLKGLTDEEDLFDNTINLPDNTDPEFKEKYCRKCETLAEGPWGRHIRLFYHLFYGEGFIVKPGATFKREGDQRPYAGIVWTGEGTINGLNVGVDKKERREFLITPNSNIEIINTSTQLDLMIFTVFPMNL